MSNIYGILGPRGVGKTSVERGLQNEYGIERIPTFTTREKRNGEIDGFDHFFIDNREFELLNNENRLFGVNKIGDTHYGLDMTLVNKIITEEKMATIDMDMQTAILLRQKIGREAMKCIGILPASWDDIAAQMLSKNVPQEEIDYRINNDPNDFTKIVELDRIFLSERGKLQDLINKIGGYCLSLPEIEKNDGQYEMGLLSNLKMSLLQYGVNFENRCQFSNYTGIDRYKTKPIRVQPTIIGSAVYNISQEKNITPSEIIISDNQINSLTKLRFDQDSPYTLSFDNSEIKIKKDGKIIKADIQLVLRDDILKQKTPFSANGLETEVGDYIEIVGADRLSVLMFEGCSNWNYGKACQFCDLHPKKIIDKQIKPTTNDISKYNGNIKEWWASSSKDYIKGVKYSIEQVSSYEKLEHKHLYFMSGNLPKNSDVWYVTRDLIGSLAKDIDLSEFDSYLNVAPHDTIDNLRTIKSYGIKQVQYNLEVANKKLFEEICPGKIGYDDFVNKLREAVTIFGRGNVRSNFVFGLQDKDELLIEIERFAKLGIVSDYSIFQPKPFTPLASKEPPMAEDIIDFSNRLADIYIKYDFKPIFCSLSSRSSIINEIYNDKTKRNL